MRTRKVRNPMLQQHSLSEQSCFSKIFATLRIGKALRHAGISKSFGLSSLAVFQIVFSLIFEVKNWFRLLECDRGADLPGKNVIYRFLNQPSFAWRRFLQTLSLRIVQDFESLISSTRVRVFIIDGSVLSRNRSKKQSYWHESLTISRANSLKVTPCLTLGWSDGFSFAPLDFVMLSSAKLANRLCEMASNLLNVAMDTNVEWRPFLGSRTRSLPCWNGLCVQDSPLTTYLWVAGLRKLHSFDSLAKKVFP